MRALFSIVLGFTVCEALFDLVESGITMENQPDQSLIIAEYLRLKDAGKNVDVDALCKKYPDMPDGLRSYITGEELFEPAAKPIDENGKLIPSVSLFDAFGGVKMAVIVSGIVFLLTSVIVMFSMRPDQGEVDLQIDQSLQVQYQRSEKLSKDPHLPLDNKKPSLPSVGKQSTFPNAPLVKQPVKHKKQKQEKHLRQQVVKLVDEPLWHSLEDPIANSGRVLIELQNGEHNPLQGKEDELNRSGRGERFISVRMIFPLRKQLGSMAKALNMTVPEVRDKVVITDFNIQRMEAVAGPNPWSGDWQDIDIKDAIKILKECKDYDEDGLSFKKTDLFTMALPMRLLGTWKKWSSHPRAERFTLSKEGKALEKRIKVWMTTNSKFIKNQNKTVMNIKKGGFSKYQFNFRATGEESLRSEGREAVLRKMEKDLKISDKEQSVGITWQKLGDDLTTSSPLLLFRYLDFSVKPGRYYRYRARVELKNPNFNKPVNEVKHNTIKTGLYRRTPWSKSTTPVLVPRDVNYYFTRVIKPTSPRVPLSAQIEVFHWLPETGTVVNSRFDVKIGEYIRRVTNTYILKPAAGTFEKEDAMIGPSKDVLVDINNDNDIHHVTARKLFKDLHLPKQQIGIGTTNLILIVDEYGRLVPKNPAEDFSRLIAEKARILRIHDVFEYIKDIRNEGPSNKRSVHKALRELTEAEFIDTPFRDVMEYFADYHLINIKFDSNLLKSNKSILRKPVNLNVKNLTLQVALEKILVSFNLTYLVNNNSIIIRKSKVKKKKQRD